MTFNIAKARDGCKQNILTYYVDFNKCEWTYMPQESDKLVESDYNKKEIFTPNISYDDYDNEELPF